VIEKMGDKRTGGRKSESENGNWEGEKDWSGGPSQINKNKEASERQPQPCKERKDGNWPLLFPENDFVPRVTIG
jgi:hypothetical protein